MPGRFYQSGQSSGAVVGSVHLCWWLGTGLERYLSRLHEARADLYALNLVQSGEGMRAFFQPEADHRSPEPTSIALVRAWVPKQPVIRTALSGKAGYGAKLASGSCEVQRNGNRLRAWASSINA